MKAIQVQHLSKKYQIGEAQSRYRTLRESIMSTFRRRKAGPENEIWALKDISFDVEQGEVVGIIGRNGAGKSTLLKLLAHITRPTEGRVVLHGRVGSLLEVGTGFHPELTGRENIFLNGAVLGMQRKEIERKFDEIVDFAEIEKFLDTPVKHYSSGMYMRLAFSVAAHLEPEILLVDEVLAVGDSAFQKKCLGKMGEVAKVGRTVLFVSHNMAAVQNLCKDAFLFNSGQLIFAGKAHQTVLEYVRSQEIAVSQKPGIFDLSAHANKYNPARNFIQRISLLDSDGLAQDSFLMGGKICIQIQVQGLSDFSDSAVGVLIKNQEEVILTSSSTLMKCRPLCQERAYQEQVNFYIDRIPFTPGSYWIDISTIRELTGRIDYVEHAAQMNVVGADVYNTGYLVSTDFGMIYLDGEWEICSTN